MPNTLRRGANPAPTKARPSRRSPWRPSATKPLSLLLPSSPAIDELGASAARSGRSINIVDAGAAVLMGDTMTMSGAVCGEAAIDFRRRAAGVRWPAAPEEQHRFTRAAIRCACVTRARLQNTGARVARPACASEFVYANCAATPWQALQTMSRSCNFTLEDLCVSGSLLPACRMPFLSCLLC